MTVEEAEQLRSRLLRLSGDLAALMGRVTALNAELDDHSAQASPVRSLDQPSHGPERPIRSGAQ